METNKQLQNLIGIAIGNDYFTLEFGCKIKRYVGLVDTFIKLESFLDGGFVIHLLKADGNPLSYGLTRDEFEDIIILGTEPTLADVLLAIKKTHENSIGFFMNQYGMFYQMVEEYQNPDSLDPILVKYKSISFNLEKGLFNQSDEIKKFIIKLLSNHPSI